MTWLCRLYISDDVEYIEQDLEQLRVLFLADGQGLPAQDIDDLCTPVVDLLNVLQLETGILIKNFKDVSHVSGSMLLTLTQIMCTVMGFTAGGVSNCLISQLHKSPKFHLSVRLCHWKPLASASIQGLSVSSYLHTDTALLFTG